MTDAFFVRTLQGYDPTEHLPGPWSPDFMHAGPPCALLAHEMAALGDRGTIPDPGFIASFHVDIVKPVPVAPVTIEAAIVREGRRVALVQARLRAQGADVMLARAWILRTAAVEVPVTTPLPPPPPGREGLDLPAGWGRGYLDAVAWDWVEGSFQSPGPATAWARPLHPLVAGEPLDPVERLLLVADSGSGISAVANPAELIFINTDLSVHLHRPPRGDAVWMRSQSFLDAQGVGLASTILGDADGAVGSGEQTLFLAPGPAAAQ